MKVAVYNRFLQSMGGGERHSSMLAQVMADEGHAVDLVGHEDVGKEILAGTTDAYRKLRNTFRYLLGALPDLAPRLLDGYDFVNGDSDPADDNGHGTMAAGIVEVFARSGYEVVSVTRSPEKSTRLAAPSSRPFRSRAWSVACSLVVSTKTRRWPLCSR